MIYDVTIITVRPGLHPDALARLQGQDFGAERAGDLLVKGAYTQSRLRQMIFGGTTRHILANAELPVLMAH